MAALRFIAIFSQDLPRLLDLARRLTPRTEARPPDALILEVTRAAELKTLEKLRASPEASRWGAASTRNAALAAARLAPGVVVQDGEETKFLASLPVSTLGLWDNDPQLPEILLTFSRWGIRTLGQLAVLPARELTARLGPAATRFQRLAHGEDLEPLQAESPERRFEAAIDLEYALDSLEPLSFILSGLIAPLCEEMRSRDLAAESVEVEFRLENQATSRRALGLALPLGDAKTIVSLLRLELQTQTEKARIIGVSVRLFPVPARALQHSLFEPAPPAPEKLARTVGRLTALVGKPNVGSPALEDSHRPDAFAMKEFGPSRGRTQSRPREERDQARSALRRFRPPVPTRLRPEQTRNWVGPWKTSGGWWTSRPWDREEWDVEFVNGVIYRVFMDARSKGWFLEGVYD
jgi:protein ImuB